MSARDSGRGRGAAIIATLLAAFTVASLLAGCGSAAPRRAGARHLPGAEPALSPPLTRPPAGRVVTVGPTAEGIVALPAVDRLAVAVRDPDRIAELSLSSGDVVGDVRIAGPARHLARRGRDTVLVPEAPINRLLELGLGPRRAARSITTGSLPHDATVADGRVFVADEFGRAITVVRGGRAVARIGPFVQPGGITTAAGRVALVDVGADTVTLVDPRTDAVLARAAAGAGPTHDAAGSGDLLDVVDTRGDALDVFAIRPRLHRVQRLALPGTPYGIAADPRRHRVWVTLTATNTLVELGGGRRLHVLARFPTVRQPNSVAVDSATGGVSVAGAAAGVVEELTPRVIAAAAR